MSINTIKPIHFMRMPDVTPEDKQVANDALQDVLFLAGVEGQVPVVDLDVWREPDYIDKNGVLVPHRSVDWYVTLFKDPVTGAMDTKSVEAQLLNDPVEKQLTHYNFIIASHCLFDDQGAFHGGAFYGRLAIVSFRRFGYIPDCRARRETMKAAVYHEGGHMFGLPGDRRTDNINSDGRHCTNYFEHGNRGSLYWCAMSKNAREFGVEEARRREVEGRDIVYCGPCRNDLRGYFGKSPVCDETIKPPALIRMIRPAKGDVS